jgi:hypothetical protein
MTAVGDQVIRLLELGDFFRLVSNDEKSRVVTLLKNDPQFDATIAQLNALDYVRDMLMQYHGRPGPPSMFDLAMVLAARADAASSGVIENKLQGLRFVDPDAQLLQSTFGMASQTFAIARNLASSMRANRVLSVAAVPASTTATVPTSPTASFSGSGATGRNIFDRTVPLTDQARIAWEQNRNPQPNPADSGPVSRDYSNPLSSGLTLPGSARERLAQAARVTSLPISTMFAPIYLNGRPSRAAVMAAAARLYRLTPEVIGAIILAEQRDQSANEDMLDYTAATHPVARRTTSVGLGQVRDDTVDRTDLFSGLLDRNRRQGLTRSQIATLLTSDEFNIFAVAKYIRYVADLVGRKTARDLPQTAAEYPGINFAAYAQPASTWPAANVEALGSEYTSRPWDDRVTGWGSFVGEAHSDMTGARIRW